MGFSSGEFYLVYKIIFIGILFALLITGLLSILRAYGKYKKYINKIPDPVKREIGRRIKPHFYQWLFERMKENTGLLILIIILSLVLIVLIVFILK